MISGIPIQYLNGIDSGHNLPPEHAFLYSTQSLLGLFNGFGNPTAIAIENQLYDYLVKTRDAVAANPKAVIATVNPVNFLEMLNYAIKYWHTPQRDQALAVLSQKEMQLVTSKSWQQLDGDAAGLGNFFKNVGAAVKTAAKKVTTTVKKVGQQVINAVVRYNPLTATIRAGILGFFRLNVNKASEKLAPAYLTLAQAKAEGISEDNWNKAKKALEKTREIYVKSLKGRDQALRNVILSGKRKEWRNPETEDPKQLENLLKANPDAIELDEGTDQITTTTIKGLGEVITATAAATASIPWWVKIWNGIKSVFKASNEVRQVIPAQVTTTQAAPATVTASAPVQPNRPNIITRAANLITNRAVPAPQQPRTQPVVTPTPANRPNLITRAGNFITNRVVPAAQVVTNTANAIQPRQETTPEITPEVNPEISFNSQHIETSNSTNTMNNLIETVKKPQNLLLIGAAVVAGAVAFNMVKGKSAPVAQAAPAPGGGLSGFKTRRKPATRKRAAAKKTKSTKKTTAPKVVRRKPVVKTSTKKKVKTLKLK